MTLQIENRTIPEELRDLILGGRCVVLIGSGPSTDCYLSWRDLVKTLCEKCGITRGINRDSPADDLLDAAQDAKESDSDAYFAFLGEHFGRHVDHGSYLYDALLSLPFECYLTVNFDPLLAFKARTARLPCSLPVCAYPSLDRKHMRNRSIHHLHGFIDVNIPPVEGSIVLARDEFDRAYRANSNLTNLLVSTLEHDPVLFIGCRLKEPEMKRIFPLCAENQRDRLRVIDGLKDPPSDPPPRFILLPRLKVRNAKGEIEPVQSREQMEGESEYYKNLDIEPLWYDATEDDHSALHYALEELADLPGVAPDHRWRREKSVYG